MHSTKQKGIIKYYFQKPTSNIQCGNADTVMVVIEIEMEMIERLTLSSTR